MVHKFTSQSAGQTSFRYVIDMDCTGERVNFSKWTRGNYDSVYAGDAVCKTDL